jgi:hypothetical protein
MAKRGFAIIERFDIRTSSPQTCALAQAGKMGEGSATCIFKGP